MKLIPGFIVDRMPVRFWDHDHLWFHNKIHFCYEWGRTIEWHGRVIGEGKRPVFDDGWVSADELPQTPEEEERWEAELDAELEETDRWLKGRDQNE